MEEEKQKLSLAGKVLDYARDPAVALWRKGAGLAAVLYVISPIDLIWDVVPVIGWLDDLGIAGVVAWFLVRDIKKHAQRKALAPSPSERADKP